MSPAFRDTPVRVRVPATSANLGPGFDAFGLALAWYDEVVVAVTDSGLRVHVTGEGAPGNEARPEAHSESAAGGVSLGEGNLVVRSLRAAFAALGGQPPGLEVTCTNRIPHGRGLGSSAAAICAGLLAARALTTGGTDRLGDEAVFALATELEGHPDNVAACLRGGFTLAWGSPEGPRVVRMDPSPEVTPVVFVPSGALSTAKARGLLPAAVPHADAAANSGRAALLVEALTRRPDLLLAATEDRLHQAYRAPAMPESAALVDKLRSAGVPAVISGAGPAVLALARNADGEAVALAGDGWRVRRAAVDRAGAGVVEPV